MRYPILYKSTETDFENNGIGILSDCMKCTISEALNGAYELKMQYPISGIHYESITRRSIIKASVNAISDPQLFRVYSVTRSMGGIVIFAEHISYDLSGMPVSTFTANNAPNALMGLKNNAVSSCPFTFWTDKSNYGDFAVSEPGSIRSQLGGKEGSILDVYGGEYEFDNFTIKLHNCRGYDRGVTIRYGKNLTNLEQDENCASCYTGVYPYWISQDGNLIELPEKVVNAPGTHNYERIMMLNLSQDFEEAPSEDQLRQKATRYVESNDIGVPKVSWKISYLDLEKSEEYKGKALLERVLLGDTVSVEFPSMGVSASARVVAYEYDAMLERNVSITLGNVKADITDTIAEQKKETENMVTPSLVQSIVSNLTAIILGAKGGSVRILDENNDGMPDTLYVADNPDPAQAIKVWRWNYEGWAGSKSGYNGPFELGATLEDGILAKAITAANLVAGTIQSQDGNSFYVNLDTGDVRIRAVNDMQTEIANTNTAVDSIEAQAAQQASQIDKVQNAVTAMEVTTQGVAIQVRSILENGVDKVTTGMGYTFDDNGLLIDKPGVEIANLLDHTGMYVTRSGENVLKATNAGVEAIDIKVKNYLVAGQHARFEDYTNGTDSKRTACFWI